MTTPILQRHWRQGLTPIHFSAQTCAVSNTPGHPCTPTDTPFTSPYPPPKYPLSTPYPTQDAHVEPLTRGATPEVLRRVRDDVLRLVRDDAGGQVSVP
jgi:hypothetical protein